MAFNRKDHALASGLMTTADGKIKCWLWSGIVLVSAMVLVGGITRLTGSGLSIVEWKLISGILPPLTHAQWEEAFHQYKQFPEYKKLNYSIDLASFKQLFFWEYLHRLLGRITGIVFLLPFLYFYFRQMLSSALKRKLILIFFLGALQGVMGWYMVKSGLKDMPHVSHFRLAIHQSLAVILIGTIFWTILSIGSNEYSVKKKSTLLPWVSLSLLFIQMVFGALVAGLKAGYSYTNFPFMGESLLPSARVYDAAPLFENGVVLQFVHRWLAFVVMLSFLPLLKIIKPNTKNYRYAKTLIALVVIQIGLGIATLMLHVPLILGVAHQFTAILLFINLIKLAHLTSTPILKET